MKNRLVEFLKNQFRKTKTQKNETPTLNEYHNSIDTLPLQSWIECHDGDMTKTRLDAKRGNQKKDEIAWEQIQDSYLKLYGMSKVLEKVYKAMRQLAILELEYVITEDRMKLTLAEMEEQKMKSLLTNKGQGISIQQSLVYLSQWMNQWITTRGITTREYFDLLEEMEKFNKQTTPQKNRRRNGK